DKNSAGAPSAWSKHLGGSAMKCYFAVLFTMVVWSSTAPAAYSGAAPESAGQILARLNKLPAE
ncbi:MAG: hypothetical protein ACXWXT_12565, partial [Candidatus Binatia bacterium]